MILNAHHIIGMESDCVNVCPHLASVQAGKLHILNKKALLTHFYCFFLK